MGLNEDKYGSGTRIRKRDIRNLGRTLQEFISKLPYTPLASSLRDALLYSALQLSRYNKSQCCKASLSETQVIFPLHIMKLLNESYPEIDLDQFRMKWERERDNLTVRRSLSGQPDICVYADNGDFTGIEEVLQYDLNLVDNVDNHGRSALAYCCRHSSPDHMTCLEILLQHNASMDQRDNDGITALHWAAYTGNADAVLSLLKHGASISITDKTGRSPLHMATQSDNPRVLQLLLQQEDVDTKVKDCRGLTPLSWAAARDNLDAVNKLKNAESNSFVSRDTYITDSQGRSFIHWAAISPHGTVCLESLIQSDISSLQDTLGWTPLHYTALTGSQKSCEVILNVLPRDKIDTPTKRGFSALHIACYHGNGDVLDSLLSNGSDYLSPTPEGSSPLEAVAKLKLHYSQLVLETHISQLRRSATPNNREKPVCNTITSIPNYLQRSLTPTPPRSPKPPLSPKKPSTPLRHHLKANTIDSKSLTRSLPVESTPLPEPTNVLSGLESSVSSQKLSGRSRPVSAKGRIRPVQSSKRPSSNTPPNGTIPPESSSRRSSTATPPSPLQKDVNGMRRTLSYDLNLDMSDQFSAMTLPPRPTAPTPPVDSDPDSVVISEASSSPPLAPQDIESATSMLGLPAQKRPSIQSISDVWNMNDSGFISPITSIPKSPSAINMRKHRPSLTSPHTMQYESYNRSPQSLVVNTQSSSPYTQAMTLPNAPHAKRSITKNPYDSIANPTQFPSSQPLLAARNSNIPRYNRAWKPTKESLPSQRSAIRINRTDVRMSTSHYNH
ncbi:hypothetical protein LOD99_13513 [Oopsacas minuta]|uniref:Inversin n=1 Tax=Oopsacas minuta TaxID=111878 RepID=A0AAV7KL28_9METZ|nr:hypothetical protein LOD99_13513 [Oopsacas minuta]